MHPIELEQTLDSMVVLVDTREQPTLRAQKRYSQFGCAYTRKKLNVGDYSAMFSMPDGEVFTLENKVVVERKMNIDELCMCYAGQRDRFEREFERAKEAETKIYLLIENADFQKIFDGKYRSKLKPQSLSASIFAWLSRYDCQIIFCTPTVTGRVIHDLLYYEAREALKAR